MDPIEPEGRRDGAERHGLLGGESSEAQRQAPPAWRQGASDRGRMWSELDFVTVDWVHDVEVLVPPHHPP